MPRNIDPRSAPRRLRLPGTVCSHRAQRGPHTAPRRSLHGRRRIGFSSSARRSGPGPQADRALDLGLTALSTSSGTTSACRSSARIQTTAPGRGSRRPLQGGGVQTTAPGRGSRRPLQRGGPDDRSSAGVQTTAPARGPDDRSPARGSRRPHQRAGPNDRSSTRIQIAPARGSNNRRKSRRPTLASGPSKPRQRPTLPQGCPCSTIGPEELNFRVRDGNGCDLFGIAARKKNNEVRSSVDPDDSGSAGQTIDRSTFKR
jgi:hypothetical protein